MNHPTSPTPPTHDTGSDSLTVDIVLADDRGGTTHLPADPEVLARFLAERRRVERGSSAKGQELN